MFFKIGVLKNFAIFTEKHLGWPLQAVWQNTYGGCFWIFAAANTFFSWIWYLLLTVTWVFVFPALKPFAWPPAPNLHLPALAPNLCLPALAPNLYLSALAPNLYLPALAPNLYLTAQPSLSLHIPTLSPQFVFTGPGLWFVRTQAAKLIYPQWCWIM